MFSGGKRLRQIEADGEATTVAGQALHLNGTAVQFDQLPSNAEAQTCPILIAHDAIERLEDVVDVRGIDARPVVLYGDARPVAVRVALRRDMDHDFAA